MSASGGISQLLKGIIIGVVLIMAIIGTMSLLESGNPLNSIINTQDSTNSKPENKKITAPSITLNPDDEKNVVKNDNNAAIGDLNAEIIEDNSASEEQKNALVDDQLNNNNQDENKPVLEDERSSEEATAKNTPPAYFGMMELSAINPSNSQSLKANYTVYDKNDVKVAESRDAKKTSYRLPTGQYKVETTLTKIDKATNKIIPVVTKSRYVIVRPNSTTSKTFELEPPTSTGVLQVSATMNDQATRANFMIQKENGEVVASRNNVTNSLFKLETGNYKVSVNKGSNKDFRRVEVKAGESLQTVFILKEAATQGKLLVRVFDIQSSTPIRADIKILSANGNIIQDLKSTTQTELTLAAGNYKITVNGPNGTSNKNIKINPGQSLSEVFRFDSPNPNVVAVDENSNETQINENVTIRPVEPPAVEPVETTNTENAKTTLNIVAQDEATRKPMKSNIYIQTPAGKHLDKRTYVDSASFILEPGVYKVTVRATNRKNTVKTIRISQNQNINETFLLLNPNKQNAVANTSPAVTNNTPSDPKTTNTPKNIATGFLNIAMLPANNQQVNRNDLRSNFIVSTLAGKKIVELTKVNVGNLKLDVGSFNVTAIYKNKRQTRRITIRPNQNTRLNFKTSDFLASKGILRSSIVDQTGRPLKGNLTVSNMSGQIVARANNVSNAVFNLPPARHNIRVNFQGLTGNEVINISANETTVQTFTIASNNAPNQNKNSQNNNQPKDIKDILREKIEKEIRRTF